MAAALVEKLVEVCLLVERGACRRERRAFTSLAVARQRSPDMHG